MKKQLDNALSIVWGTPYYINQQLVANAFCSYFALMYPKEWTDKKEKNFLKKALKTT